MSRMAQATWLLHRSSHCEIDSPTQLDCRHTNSNRHHAAAHLGNLPVQAAIRCRGVISKKNCSKKLQCQNNLSDRFVFENLRRAKAKPAEPIDHKPRVAGSGTDLS
jgi:hypothetical protein